jgi:hypothetical protein
VGVLVVISLRGAAWDAVYGLGRPRDLLFLCSLHYNKDSYGNHT